MATDPTPTPTPTPDPIPTPTPTPDPIPTPTPTPTPKLAAQRAPAEYTYKIAQLPPYEPSFEINAANADFVGKSPGLTMKVVESGFEIPMRQFVPGDVIVFDLTQLKQIVGPDPVVNWVCRQRLKGMGQGRIFMGNEGNKFQIFHGTSVVINDPGSGAALEHWGMWAEITVTVGQDTLLYTTADPEGVLGNGGGNPAPP
jgi:hypothetical protein